MFGQMIPKFGFGDNGALSAFDKAITQYKSMRTQDLKLDREEEKERLDDSIQFKKSREELVQYNEVKEIMLNLSFKYKGKMILSNDIVWDVLDEVRKERKVIMALTDDTIDDYINLDMTEIDILTSQNNTDITQQIKYACGEKLAFRQTLAQDVSLFRLDYILRVMRKVMGKYTIADPSGFKQKLKIMKKRERADKIAQFKRSNSKKSEFTEITGSDGISTSKISGTGTSDGASSRGAQIDNNSEAGNQEQKEEDDEGHNDDSINNSNQLLPMMNNIFSDISNNINTKGKDKLDELKKMHMIDEVDEYSQDGINGSTPLDDLVNDLIKE